MDSPEAIGSQGSPDSGALFEVASTQAGYFTAGQAHRACFSARLLQYHTDTGRFIRLRRGLYRLRDYPSSPREEVMAAWLAVGKEPAIVSHESALDLLGLSNVTSGCDSPHGPTEQAPSSKASRCPDPYHKARASSGGCRRPGRNAGHIAGSHHSRRRGSGYRSRTNRNGNRAGASSGHGDTANAGRSFGVTVNPRQAIGS